jgi:hypothetical protein
MLAMNETDLYQADWIGLRSLVERGSVVTKLIKGEHMQFSLEDFREHMLPYLIKPYTMVDIVEDTLILNNELRYTLGSWPVSSFPEADIHRCYRDSTQIT